MYSLRMRASQQGRHISGAEGIYCPEDLDAKVSAMLGRALNHKNGSPDRVDITVERLEAEPVRITALCLTTAVVDDPGQCQAAIKRLLNHLGIEDPIIECAKGVLYSPYRMSGAALMDKAGGRRLEGDMHRGVRVSRLGITQDAQRVLTERLELLGLTHFRVAEALIVASKAASCPDIIAEICISDDPDYTTGYVASRAFGYIRLAHIKPPGSMVGGRVFFVRPNTSIYEVTSYLERVAVLVDSIPTFTQGGRVDELLSALDS